MMDVREKLVELLVRITCNGSEEIGSCQNRKYGFCGEVNKLDYCVIQHIADHLISHGVTVNERALPVADEATERSVAVDKIEDQRKSEGFTGHRKPEQEWISVKDRLPEPFVSVLVQMPGEQPFPTVREGFISKDGIWHSALYDREPDEVTHWRPMPQPPKGE